MEKTSDSADIIITPSSSKRGTLLAIGITLLVLITTVVAFLSLNATAPQTRDSSAAPSPLPVADRYETQDEPSFIRGKVLKLESMSLTVEGRDPMKPFTTVLPSDARYICSPRFVKDAEGNLLPRAAIKKSTAFITDEWIRNLKPDRARQVWYSELIESGDVVELNFDPKTGRSRLVYATVIKDECPEAP